MPRPIERLAESAGTCLIWAGAAVFAGIAVRSLLHPDAYLYSISSSLVLLWFPMIFVALLLFLLFFTKFDRQNIAIVLIAIAAALYSGELGLILVQPYIESAGRGTRYDSRSKLAVIKEYRGRGLSAYPAVHPRQIMEDPLVLDGNRVVPLGGAALAPTVLCNEWGKYYVYDSDEYGFNNPPGTWRRAYFDLAIVGDSFGQGFCLPNGASFPELLRKQYPATVNVSSSGNGPLAELASIREYLRHAQPKKVLWFYYEGNDIEDLTREMLDPTVSRYLAEPSFTQSLRERSGQVDKALKAYLDRKIADEESRPRIERVSAGDLRRGLLEWVKLYNIRTRLGLANMRQHWVLDEYRPEVSREAALQAFKHILAEANNITNEWGGKLYFIYLPAWETFARFEGHAEHPFKKAVLESAAQLHIPVADLTEDFRRGGRPLDFFPFQAHLHYNEKGSALVASRTIEFFSNR